MFSPGHSVGDIVAVTCGVTVMAENGKVLTGSPITFANSLLNPRLTDPFFRFGASLDRRIGAIEATLGAS